MKVLVLNSGSSSVKYRLFAMRDETVLASGLLERIGQSGSRLTHIRMTRTGDLIRHVLDQPAADHEQGLDRIVEVLRTSGVLDNPSQLFGIGHRVVHGGEAFRAPVLLDPTVIEAIRAVTPLAPLHNPPNLLGIEVALRLAPDVSQVAVFDTAFHRGLPPEAFRYALPREFYERYRVRRYGFHGTSHQHVANQAAAFLGKALSSINLITLHLGNGASAAAIRAGACQDTSMGMTPLEGLIMGTRCGDLDPVILFYLERVAGLSSQELESVLNHDSGLKGICGVQDMRTVHQRADAGDPDAELALSMYAYRIRKYLGAYFAVLGQVDAIVFTGGIGENDADTRARVCKGLHGLGIQLDDDRNRSAGTGVAAIHTSTSPVSLLVIPTNEELEIARQTVKEIQASR